MKKSKKQRCVLDLIQKQLGKSRVWNLLLLEVAGCREHSEGFVGWGVLVWFFFFTVQGEFIQLKQNWKAFLMKNRRVIFNVCPRMEFQTAAPQPNPFFLFYSNKTPAYQYSGHESPRRSTCRLSSTAIYQCQYSCANSDNSDNIAP